MKKTRKVNFLVRYWYSLSLKKKLLVFFLPVNIFAFAIVLYFSTTTYQSTNRIQKTLDIHYNINAFVNELQNCTKLLNRYIFDDQSSRLNITEEKIKIEGILNKIASASFNNKEADFQFRAIKTSTETYFVKAFELLSKFDGQEPYYPVYYTLEKVHNYIESYANTLQNELFTDGEKYYREQISKSAWTERIVILFIVVAAIVVLRSLFVFAEWFTRPIKDLAERSQKIASGMLYIPPIELKEKYDNEIYVLSDSFNQMSQSIREKVAKLKHQQDLELALKESQLVSLQQQIKPHFLFNTLNIISRSAEKEKAKKTQSLVYSLATLFRFNLISHSQTVSLEKELEALGEYVTLQKTRFGSRLTFIMNDCTVPETFQIPPYMLLTFVENAISHGIEPKINGGKVILDIKVRKNSYLFRILDTGVGMDDEAKKRITDMAEHKNVTNYSGAVHGVGIKNIISRLYLLYEEKAGIHIYSKVKRGTLIAITLPAEK